MWYDCVRALEIVRYRSYHRSLLLSNLLSEFVNVTTGLDNNTEQAFSNFEYTGNLTEHVKKWCLWRLGKELFTGFLLGIPNYKTEDGITHIKYPVRVKITDGDEPEKPMLMGHLLVDCNLLTKPLAFHQCSVRIEFSMDLQRVRTLLQEHHGQDAESVEILQTPFVVEHLPLTFDMFQNSILAMTGKIPSESNQ